MQTHSLAWLFVLALILSSCSIEVNQATSVTPSSESASISPPDLSALGLSGRLVYSIISMKGDIYSQSVQTFDLKTGEFKTIFTVPEGANVYYTSASTDGKQVILSYVPPKQGNFASNQALYIIPLDGSKQPRLLLTPPTEYDQYIQVEWSPDGKHIYFVHNNYHDQPSNQVFPSYEIFRIAYPDGSPEKIVDHAFWPRISSDSSKLVYVSLNPISGENELFVADANGSNAQRIALTGPVLRIIDAPFFSADGQVIFFSTPSPTQSYQPNWFDKLTGVRIAKAHNVPSDWWSVPLMGGKPTRLTHIQSTGLFGAILPDQKHIVSFSQQGLFFMNLDGSDLTLLIPDPGGTTVNWIP